MLVDNPNVAFSHVMAGYYAGMGTIGDSHNLIIKEFGPRLRIVSILTDALIPADPMPEKDLCIYCKKCLKTVRSIALRKVKAVYTIRISSLHEIPCEDPG